jgi:hypothetical protein
MNGKRRRFHVWRMSLLANRIPLRRDMRWSCLFFVRVAVARTCSSIALVGAIVPEDNHVLGMTAGASSAFPWFESYEAAAVGWVEPFAKPISHGCLW